MMVSFTLCIICTLFIFLSIKKTKTIVKVKNHTHVYNLSYSFVMDYDDNQIKYYAIYLKEIMKIQKMIRS